jgi:hypothetical protein
VGGCRFSMASAAPRVGPRCATANGGGAAQQAAWRSRGRGWHDAAVRAPHGTSVLRSATRLDRSQASRPHVFVSVSVARPVRPPSFPRDQFRSEWINTTIKS